jgi:hypothetical protein
LDIVRISEKGNIEILNYTKDDEGRGLSLLISLHWYLCPYLFGITFLSALTVIIAKISCIIAYEPIESKLEEINTFDLHQKLSLTLLLYFSIYNLDNNLHCYSFYSKKAWRFNHL